MKNKLIWLPVAFIAVAVVGAAVWFGNTATQKGSLGQPTLFQPSGNAAQQQQAGPQTCGTSWTNIYSANITSVSHISNPLLKKLASTQSVNFEGLVKQGCSFKIVYNLNYKDNTHRDSQSVECALAYGSAGLTCYSKDFGFSSLLGGIEGSGTDYYFVPAYNESPDIVSGSLTIFAKK